jgi:hypothetical protein
MRAAQFNRPRLEGVALSRKAGPLGASIDVGVGIGIGIDRKAEYLFLQTYMQIPEVDSEPDSDLDPRCAPAINARRNG